MAEAGHRGGRYGDRQYEATAEVSLTDGEGKAEDLATGLYLVMADKAQTTNYEYTLHRI